jgi:small GTP-binding protein
MKTLSKKVCLLGDFAVGKTSLVERFVYNRFSSKYISTLGVQVSSKAIVIPHEDDLIELKIMLWDLAGSEAFNQIRANYLRGASGAILVADLSRPETTESLVTYFEQLFHINPTAQVIFAANKSDLFNSPPPIPAKIEQLASELKTTCYLTSNKTGEAVEALFRQLGKMLIS